MCFRSLSRRQASRTTGGSTAPRSASCCRWTSYALVLLPLVLLLLPEPVGALLQHGRAITLARLNRSLRALGQPAVDTMPAHTAAGDRAALPQLFAPGLRAITVLLTLAYFCHIMTFYFILKWAPKIVTDMGFAPASGGGVLVWANIGGLTGSLVFSFLSTRIAVRRLLMAALALSAVAVAAFGQMPANLALLSETAALAGVATNGAMVLFYALIAQSFPTVVRAGGTGFVIGLGRGGAVLGPVLAGLAFQSGLALPAVAAFMACGSLAAIVAVWRIPGGAKIEPASA